MLSYGIRRRLAFLEQLGLIFANVSTFFIFLDALCGIFVFLDLPSEIAPDGMKATVCDGLLESKLRKVGVREKEREIARAATARAKETCDHS